MIETRAEPLGIEVVVADLHRRRPAGPATCFGVLLQYPGASGARARPDRAGRRPRKEQGRGRRRRRRPARPDPADARPASSAPTSRSAPRSGSACRWASADRTPATWRCARASSGSMPGRLVGVSVDADGAPGVPAGAADPRAAHPPGEGDQQHLHRAGAARRHGRHVRRLPRPRRAAGDRPAHPPLRGRARRGAAVGRASRSCTTRSSTPSWPVRRAGPPPSSPRPASAGSTCASSTPTTSAIACDETTTRAHLAAVWAAFGVDADESDADRLAARTGCPPSCCATTRS